MKDYGGKCPYHHSLHDACQNEGEIPVSNPFGDDAYVIRVCLEHLRLYLQAGWRNRDWDDARTQAGS